MRTSLSVSTGLLKARELRPVFCRVVICRSSCCGSCVGPPTAFPFGHRCAVGVLPGLTGGPQIPGLLCGKRANSLWLCWLESWHRVFYALGRVVVMPPRSCATENTYREEPSWSDMVTEWPPAFLIHTNRKHLPKAEQYAPMFTLLLFHLSVCACIVPCVSGLRFPTLPLNACFRAYLSSLNAIILLLMMNLISLSLSSLFSFISVLSLSPRSGKCKRFSCSNTTKLSVWLLTFFVAVKRHRTLQSRSISDCNYSTTICFLLMLSGCAHEDPICWLFTVRQTSGLQ